MSEEKKKSEDTHIDVNLGFGNLFKGVGNLIDVVSGMMEEGKEEIRKTGEIKGLGEKVKGVYGVTIKMGLGGIPEVVQFGNIRETGKGAVVEEVREPLVDTFVEEDKVIVVAEMPGVDESNIHLEVKEDILIIEASDKDRKYAKELLLPCPVVGTVESSYKNGVLEIMLRKRAKS